MCVCIHIYYFITKLSPFTLTRNALSGLLVYAQHGVCEKAWDYFAKKKYYNNKMGLAASPLCIKDGPSLSVEKATSAAVRGGRRPRSMRQGAASRAGKRGSRLSHGHINNLNGY